MSIGRTYFEIAFPDIPDPVVEVWRTFASALDGKRCLPNRFELMQLAGHPEQLKSEQYLRATPDEIEALIVARDLRGFWVDSGRRSSRVSYKLLHAKEQGRQSVLSCHIEENAKTIDDWTPLIEALMTQWPAIGAWQWDHFYHVWQWVKTPDGYKRRFGELPPKMPTFIQRSPCSLSPDRELLDISMNPGRPKEMLPTINFYPTAEMWLGPDFWKHAKCTKEEALAADFFLNKRDTPHFLYLKSWREPFTRPDGEQGRQQQLLWKLFFNEDCEWPPGSGGICDKPMYGPPELLPPAT